MSLSMDVFHVSLFGVILSPYLKAQFGNHCVLSLPVAGFEGGLT
jgi:hypothetical protein